MPIILDFEKYSRTAASKKLLDTYDDDWKNILFVGRIFPNKCQEDVILAFYMYKRYINPQSRLFLVGMPGIERYDFMLEAIFKNINDLEAFIEYIEEEFGIVEKHVFYIISEIKREEFMIPIIS